MLECDELPKVPAKTGLSKAPSVSRPRPTLVAHVVPYYPPHLGGMENVASALAEGFATRGSVVVLTSRSGARNSLRVERSLSFIRATQPAKVSSSDDYSLLNGSTYHLCPLCCSIFYFYRDVPSFMSILRKRTYRKWSGWHHWSDDVLLSLIFI